MLSVRKNGNTYFLALRALALATAIVIMVSSLCGCFLRQDDNSVPTSKPATTAQQGDGQTETVAETPDQSQTETPAPETTPTPENTQDAAETPTEASTGEPTDDPDSTEAATVDQTADPAENSAEPATEPATETPTEEATEAATPTPHVHAYEKTAEKAATCTSEGSVTYTCAGCGDVRTETVSALGHAFGAFTTTREATCLEGGEETSRCERCGASQTRATPRKDHNWVQGETENDTTRCTYYRVNTCSTCGATCAEIISTYHSLVNASNQYVSRVECEHCHKRFTDYYNGFEALSAPYDETSPVYTDKVHFTKTLTSYRIGWSKLWLQFENAVKGAVRMYRAYGSDDEDGYPDHFAEIYYGDLSQDECREEYEKFRNAFAEVYGWKPAEAEIYTGPDQNFWTFREKQWQAFNSQAASLSDAQKAEITDRLVNEFILDTGIFDGMQLYMAVGAICDTLGDSVRYDNRLGYHSAFYALCAGTAVCDGYAEVVTKACKILGINCETVIGKYSGQGHAWNKITFSNGTERYVDSTNLSAAYLILITKERMQNMSYTF